MPVSIPVHPGAASHDAANAVWAAENRVEGVRCGLAALGRLLENRELSADECEGVSWLCEMLADELGRAHVQFEKAAELARAA